MPRFHFRAVTAAGEFVEGELEAQSQAAVVEQLRDRGHLPLAAEPLGERAGPGGRSSLQDWLRQPLFGSGRVRRGEVAIITRELATLLGCRPDRRPVAAASGRPRRERGRCAA